MKNLFSEIKDGKILIQIDKDFYENEALAQAANSLNERFSFQVEPLDEKTVGIYFSPKIFMPDQELTEAAFYLCSEISRKRSRLDS
jgi:hypothetical protein